MIRSRVNLAILKYVLPLITALFVLQFINYDWNIFNLHLFGNRRQHETIEFQMAQPVKQTDISAEVKNEVHNIIEQQQMSSKAKEAVDGSNPARIADCDFRIIVITYNRPKSLLRLLASLNGVDYLDDKICLEVWIDRSKKNIIDQATLMAAKNFTFTKGHMTVHPQEKHAGLYGQWIHTWQPKEETKEIAVILEDDLTLSPFFYRYLKKVHARYDHKPEINGYSLQGKNMKHGNGAGGNVHAPANNIVYSYPVVGSWGFSPSRDNWIAFQKWFDVAHQNKTFQPLVPGIQPTQWYSGFIKSGKTDGMWTMWHIYHAYKNKERTLYVNFSGERGMSINWRENGLHFSKAAQKGDPLVLEWDPRLDNLPDEPIYLNVYGKEVK